MYWKRLGQGSFRRFQDSPDLPSFSGFQAGSFAPLLGRALPGGSKGFRPQASQAFRHSRPLERFWGLLQGFSGALARFFGATTSAPAWAPTSPFCFADVELCSLRSRSLAISRLIARRHIRCRDWSMKLRARAMHDAVKQACGVRCLLPL